MSFEELGLSPVLCQTVHSLNYLNPTDIQSQAIPYILRGSDILASAQTGTGKTASFLLPVIDILSQTPSKARLPRVVILEPTRELALQVMEQFKNFTSQLKLSAVVLVGGESISDQERALKRGVDVIIATPGRLLDLIERQKIMLLDVRYAVIDEADRMLDMGFIPDVNRLMALLPKKRQTLLFSATLANEIVDLAAHYLLTPKRITVAQDLTTAATVTQYKISLPDAEKRQAVCHLVETFSKDAHAIVFCNRKRDVDVLVRSLCRHGFKAAGLHGDMAQTARNQTLESFRNGELDILVASDVAARGLDVKNLSLVVNFNVPNHGEDYVHRVGRTGRAGATGHAFTLVTSAEEKKWSFIEKHLGTQVKVYALPTTTPEKQSAENRAPEKQTVEKQSVEKNGSEKREKRVYPTSTRKKFEESDTPVLGFGAAIPAFMSNGTEGSRTTVNNQ